MNVEASSSPARRAPGELIMRGKLTEHSVVDVLLALSLTRQYSCVELLLTATKSAGRVFVKSGMVLGVEVDEPKANGLAAFKTLLAQPVQSYAVYRLPPMASYPPPLGRLSSQLVMDGTLASTTPAPAGAPRPTQGSVIAVVSPKGGCGKTTISLNLSLGLARSGLKVILVDIDPNGDVLSALAARSRAKVGIYDVVHGSSPVEPAIIQSVIPNLRIIASQGEGTPFELLQFPPDGPRWRRLLQLLAAQCDVVLVDTPAGMFGVSASIMEAADRVLGILQAEVIPQRSFAMFEYALGKASTKALGVVLNMVNHEDPHSREVARSVRTELKHVFTTEVPRDVAFNNAAATGAPIADIDTSPSATLTAVFDELASEFRRRSGILPAARAKGQSFLL